MKLGNKCTCKHCKVRFYDLGKVPAICPSCGTEYVVAVVVPKTRSKRSVVQN